MKRSEILQKLMDYKNFDKKTDFAKFLDVKINTLSNWFNRETFDEELILSKFPEVKKSFILAGEGAMLKSDDYPERKTPFEELQEKWEKADNYLIPLYDDVSTFGSNVDTDMSPVSQPTEYINAGSWFGKTKLTAGIRHYGDSMVEYPSGCILAIKEITDFDNIIPGQNYVIETSEARVTKKVQFSTNDKIIMAYSTNRETHPDGTLIYQPFPIKKEKIMKISLVVGRIVKEYSSGDIITV